MFEVTRHMIDIDHPGIHENLREQMNEMEPDNFIKAAMQKYSGIVIE